MISNGYEKSMEVEIEEKRFSRNAHECIEFLKKAVHQVHIFFFFAFVDCVYPYISNARNACLDNIV
eukprot:COSAG05_NODE_2950_length_2473_cov_60.232098_3_plen_66_part_00